MNLDTVPLDRSTGRPLYLQICEALISAIERGVLPPGERLPSERDLANWLAVSRTTAAAAYRELEARGLVRGHVGRGTYICAVPDGDGAPFAWRGEGDLAAQRTVDPALRSLVRAAADAEMISFAAGSAALDCFPVDLFRETTDRVLRDNPAAALGLGPTEGQPALRRALATRFGARPEMLLILTGAQQGLDLIARCLLDPGDRVVMDRPGYLGAIQTFRAAGAHIAGWDAERADLAEIEDLILRYRPKLLYTNPTFQNPTGRTLPAGTRRDLLALAARYRLPVVEDEPYRELTFGVRPPPALFHLDEHALVIHLGTFSKTFAPGLRLGWLAASPAIVDQLTLIKQHSDVFTATLPQLVVARLLQDGRYDAHLGALRIQHAARHATMLRELDRCLPPGTMQYAPVEGGLYVWCRLTGGLDATLMSGVATAAGVSYVSGDLFYPDPVGACELRLCFTSAPPARIEQGVQRLAGVIASGAAHSHRADSTRPLV
ncbi:MAG: PLP-dependent aminotransferase family protein [Dehalococcoidia bacterium]